MEATCCGSLGEKCFHELNRAFVQDPAIDEIDIIICPDCEREQNKAGGLVIVEQHKLGVKSWGVRPLFLYSYRRLMRHWRGQARDYSLTTTEAIQLSRSVLLFSPECCTAWNIRKELVISGILSAAEDLQFSSLVLTKHPRSSETFSQRRWIILHLHKKFSEHHSSQSFVRPELAVCSRAADRYPDNHTAWSHRGWLLQLFFGQDRKTLLSELQFARQWVHMHVSDHCGFHYRQQLFHHLKAFSSEQEAITLLVSELDLTTDLLLAFPGHESVWYHRRFVLNSLLFWPANSGAPSPLDRGVGKGVESADCMQTNNTKSSEASDRHTGASRASSVSAAKSDGTPAARQPGPSRVSDERAFCARVVQTSTGAKGELQCRLAASHLRWVNLRTGGENGTLSDRSTSHVS